MAYILQATGRKSGRAWYLKGTVSEQDSEDVGRVTPHRYKALELETKAEAQFILKDWGRGYLKLQFKVVEVE